MNELLLVVLVFGGGAAATAGLMATFKPLPRLHLQTRMRGLLAFFAGFSLLFLGVVLDPESEFNATHRRYATRAPYDPSPADTAIRRAAAIPSTAAQSRPAPAPGPTDTPSSSVPSMHPLTQAELAFIGSATREQIKEQLDRAFLLYGLPATDENYSRAGSTLVALRKANGTPEMAILAYMIRSHVPGVDLTFPQAAGISSAFLRVGDR